MKKFIPQNDIVLCKLENGPHKTTESGFIYTTNDIPTYRVIATGPKVSATLDLQAGDIIRTNSNGTIANDNGEEFYMFKSENVMGKVENNGKE